MFDFETIREMKFAPVFDKDHEYTDLDLVIETVEHGKQVAKYLCQSTPELGDKLHHIDIEWQSSVNVKFDFKELQDAIEFRDLVLANGYKAVSILNYRDTDYYTVEVRSSIELYVGTIGEKFGTLMLNLLRDFAPKGYNAVNRIYSASGSATIGFIDPVGYALALVTLERFALDSNQAVTVQPVEVVGVAVGEYAIQLKLDGAKE